MARNKSKLVPECRQMLEQMKYEIAAEFGIYTGGSHAGGATQNSVMSWVLQMADLRLLDGVT